MKCEDGDGDWGMEGEKKIYFFLFVNTKSGDKQGEKFIQLCGKRIKYIFQNGVDAIVETFDLFDTHRTSLGFAQVKQISEEENSQIRLIICGGDGTIPWVLGKCRQIKIDFEKIVIGVLPIGTGNDFSRSLGWGSNSAAFRLEDLSELHDLVRKWKDCQIGYYDMWDITIQTFEDGCFFEIKNQIEEKIPVKALSKSFSNYFGVGLEARVVYTVEQHRGSNAFLNKFLYTVVGARNIFKPMPLLVDVIQNFKQTQNESQRGEEQNGKNLSEKEEKEEKEKEEEEEDIGTMVHEKNGSNENQVVFPLKNNLKGMVGLNCPSYMAGLRDVWKTRKKSHESLDILQEEQKYDDGNIEFIGFSNEINLALERITRRGYKIGQGPGPFEINFKRNEANPEIFMQVDGESVKVRYLKRIRVKRSQKFPNGKIAVMVNK